MVVPRLLSMVATGAVATVVAVVVAMAEVVVATVARAVVAMVVRAVVATVEGESRVFRSATFSLYYLFAPILNFHDPAGAVVAMEVVVPLLDGWF